MRSMHPLRPALLLSALALAAPLSAQVPGGLRTIPPPNPRAQTQATVVVEAAHLQSLQGRLTGFAAQLPAEERALWEGLLERAAAAPATLGAIRVTPVLQIGPGGGCEDQPGLDDAAGRVGLIVQGGRTAGASGIVVQGGRRAPATRAGIVVQGGRTAAGPPAANAPRPNPAGDGVVAIGPKQDDPAPPPQSLGRRIAQLSTTLPEEERAALEWLLTRAAAAPEGRPGTPGGLPPGPCMCVSLRQALGIDVLAIGPKQDDPAPPPPSAAAQWTLRY